MSRSIWKFQLSHQDHNIVMPRGAKVLSVHEQFGNICMWADVDTEADKENRSFYVYGTGA